MIWRRFSGREGIGEAGYGQLERKREGHVVIVRRNRKFVNIVESGQLYCQRQHHAASRDKPRFDLTFVL